MYSDVAAYRSWRKLPLLIVDVVRRHAIAIFGRVNEQLSEHDAWYFLPCASATNHAGLFEGFLTRRLPRLAPLHRPALGNDPTLILSRDVKRAHLCNGTRAVAAIEATAKGAVKKE